MPQRLTIVGAGWAGLSAAVKATQCGLHVHLIEASATAGGRAKSIVHQGLRFDNGQHALLGAYSASLSLIESLGLREEDLFERQALKWSYPLGQAFALPEDRLPLKLARSLLLSKRFDALEKLSLLKPFVFWLRQQLLQLRSSPAQALERASVAEFFQGVSPKIIQDLISPLCLSAMNTPLRHASASTFLRVLSDSLADAPSSCEFLWPKKPLSEIMPSRAIEWLREQGAIVELGQRIDRLSPVDPQAPCLLALPAWEACKLSEPVNPQWSELARRLKHRAIATVYVRGLPTGASRPLQGSLLCLHEPLELEDCVHPQFAVRLSLPSSAPSAASSLAHKPASKANTNTLAGLEHWAMIVSAAHPFKRQEIIQNALALASKPLKLQEPEVLFCSVEKRATFSCDANIQRPPHFIAQGLWACGDYVQGPYPSTIEGAVRSGMRAVELICRSFKSKAKA